MVDLSLDSPIVAGLVGAGLGFGAKYTFDYLNGPPADVSAVASKVSITTTDIATNSVKYIMSYPYLDLSTTGYMFAVVEASGDVLCVFSVIKNTTLGVYWLEFGSQHGNPITILYDNVVKATLSPSVPVEVLISHPIAGV